MGEPRAKAVGKKVTAELSHEAYLQLTLAKLYSGKPLRLLLAEGCALIAEHYRSQRAAERIVAGEPGNTP